MTSRPILIAASSACVVVLAISASGSLAGFAHPRPRVTVETLKNPWREPWNAIVVDPPNPGDKPAITAAEVVALRPLPISTAGKPTEVRLGRFTDFGRGIHGVLAWMITTPAAPIIARGYPLGSKPPDWSKYSADETTVVDAITGRPLVTVQG
jgi:hypothetical protein